MNRGERRAQARAERRGESNAGWPVAPPSPTPADKKDAARRRRAYGCGSPCGRFDSMDGRYQHRCVLPLGHDGDHRHLCTDRTPWEQVRRQRDDFAKVRPSILARDGRRCQACCVSETIERLEVDHIIGLRNGGTNDPRNLWSLCKACHAAKTRHDFDHNPRADLIVRALRARGYRATYTLCRGGHRPHHVLSVERGSSE